MTITPQIRSRENVSVLLCQRSSKSPPGSLVHEEDSQDSGIRSKSSKGKKARGVKAGGNQGQHPRVLSQWTHRGHTSFLQQWVGTTCVKCCLLKKLTRDSVSKVFTGAGHLGAFCLACSKIPDSKRKSGVQHSPYCWYKQLRHSKPVFSIREWWEPTWNLSFRYLSRANLASVLF